MTPREVRAPVTIQGELTVPHTVLAGGRSATEVEAWLRQMGMLPRGLLGCRWRLAAERQGYVLAYEVTLPDLPT
jgi:hypothetical protein